MWLWGVCPRAACCSSSPGSSSSSPRGYPGGTFSPGGPSSSARRTMATRWQRSIASAMIGGHCSSSSATCMVVCSGPTLPTGSVSRPTLATRTASSVTARTPPCTSTALARPSSLKSCRWVTSRHCWTGPRPRLCLSAPTAGRTRTTFTCRPCPTSSPWEAAAVATASAWRKTSSTAAAGRVQHLATLPLATPQSRVAQSLDRSQRWQGTAGGSPKPRLPGTIAAGSRSLASKCGPWMTGPSISTTSPLCIDPKAQMVQCHRAPLMDGWWTQCGILVWIVCLNQDQSARASAFHP
mmetsp:Transcript_18251/g.45130  ORF Transcript_18251/g.45130 Transcript_18251/m.45130 type:complete len:295 (-) Transcript_18251:85-969(-)